MAPAAAGDQLTPPAIAPPTPKLAYRTSGRVYLYRESKGGIAFGVDGSPIDRAYGSVDGELVGVSSSWFDPGCPRQRCPRLEFLRLFDSHSRRDWRDCCGKGRLMPAEDPFPFVADERRVIELRARGPIARKWKIGDRYTSASLFGDNVTQAVQHVRRFLGIGADPDDDSGVDDDEPPALFLAGPTGVGKSWAIIAGFFYQSIWYSGEQCVFRTAPQLARIFAGKDAELDANEGLDQCVEADLLVLDDLGSEFRANGGDGFIDAQFEQLFCEREAADRATLVATNLTIPRFNEVMGDRVADRVAGSWARWITLPGASLRRKPRPRE